MNIAITGSSGVIGGRVARLLSQQGFPLTLLVRSPARAPSLPDTKVLVCHYGNADEARQALAGINLLFMVSAAESPTRDAEHRSFVHAAQQAGVRHIVYLSFADARPDSTFTLARTHADTEQAIRESGMSWTFLRDNFYTELMAHLADANGVIRGPAGEGRVACVSQRDVAEAAARVLADIARASSASTPDQPQPEDSPQTARPATAHETPDSPRSTGQPAASPSQPDTPHHNRTYTLTGPQSLTMAEIATELTRATGKPHRFHNESLDEAHASRRAGWPDAQQWELDAWVSTYTAIAHGELAEMTDDLQTLIGRPPLTLPLTLALAKQP